MAKSTKPGPNTSSGPDLTVAKQPPILGEAPTSQADLDTLAENIAHLEFSASFAPIINNRDFGGHLFRFDRPDAKLRVLITGGTLWLRENNVGKNDVTGIRNFFWTSNTVVDESFSQHQTAKVMRKPVVHHGVLDLLEAVGDIVAKKDPAMGEFIKKRRQRIQNDLAPMIGIKIINRECSGPGHRCNVVWNRFASTKNGRLLHPNSLPANLQGSRDTTTSNGTGCSSGSKGGNKGSNGHACLLNVFTDQHVKVDDFDPDNPNRLRCSPSLPVDARGVPDVARVMTNPWYNQLYNSDSGSIPPVTNVVLEGDLIGIFVSSTNIDARMKLHVLPVCIVAEPTRYEQNVELDSKLLDAAEAVDLEKIFAESSRPSNDHTASDSDGSEGERAHDDSVYAPGTQQGHARHQADLPHFSSNVFMPESDFQQVDRSRAQQRKTHRHGASSSGEIPDRRRDTLSDAIATVEANVGPNKVRSTKYDGPVHPNSKNLLGKRSHPVDNHDADDDTAGEDRQTVRRHRTSRSKSHHRRGIKDTDRQRSRSRSSSSDTVVGAPTPRDSNIGQYEQTVDKHNHPTRNSANKKNDRVTSQSSCRKEPLVDQSRGNKLIDGYGQTSSDDMGHNKPTNPLVETSRLSEGRKPVYSSDDGAVAGDTEGDDDNDDGYLTNSGKRAHRLQDDSDIEGTMNPKNTDEHQYPGVAVLSKPHNEAKRKRTSLLPSRAGAGDNCGVSTPTVLTSPEADSSEQKKINKSKVQRSSRSSKATKSATNSVTNPPIATTPGIKSTTNPLPGQPTASLNDQTERMVADTPTTVERESSHSVSTPDFDNDATLGPTGYCETNEMVKL